MSEALATPLSGQQSTQAPIVNEFAITFSTINGSGSATANTTLLRALFKMGIPVAGKNIFPSNIQGLPTWYTIRVNKYGYLARKEEDDIVVAMNPATFREEMEHIVPGGVFFYADDIPGKITRTDISVYPMPVKKLIKEADVSPKLRDYIANMVYVGVVAQMLGIELDKIYTALDFHFKGRSTPIDANFKIVKAAAEWAAANLTKTDPYQVTPMDATAGKIMADGNTAGALGSIYGGVQFAAWYPITPASSLAEALNEYLPQLRKDPQTGKDTYVVIQSEDEIAAIGMAVGAGWSGLRSMTSTSGPGVSLMAQYLGLPYYSETPLVLWDVQRVGPSTGLPTRTAQGDLTFVNYISHGDTRFVILLPGNINECFEFGWRSFDLAERLQTPVIVLSDLDLGMNQWMADPFEYPETPMDRGKILWEDDLNEMLKQQNNIWGRYMDVDGDGIPYRTLPGNLHPRSSYFARGTGHDEFARYTEDPQVWERVSERMLRKFETAKGLVPAPVVKTMEDARIGIIGFGSSDASIEEARIRLQTKGLASDYLRIRALPFTNEVEEFLRTHERIYVIEMNQDGQMRQLLTVAYPELAPRLIKAAHMDGLPLSARWITETILAKEE